MVKKVEAYLCPCGFVHTERRSAEKCEEAYPRGMDDR